MRKIYTSFLSLLTAGLLFVGCSNQEDLGGSSEGASSLPPYSVSFKLSGSGSIIGENATRSSVSNSSRALHNEKEQTINSLYAVVFEDVNTEGSPTTGTKGGEEPEDKFFTAIPLDLSNYPEGDPNLTFSVGKAGNFKVCFIANPSGHPSGEGAASGLVAKIQALTPGTSTVADFKALLEEGVLNAADAPTEFLMTSKFYSLITDFKNVQTIETVTLTRAMARFDIINAADGYVIKEVVFHNRGIKTPVISDTPGYVEKYLEESKTYTMSGDGLVGSSATDGEPANKYEAHIYSFEQYAGNGEDFDESTAVAKRLPYLEVKYTIPSVSETRVYSHNVYFKKAKGDQPKNGYMVNPVKRNTLYRIKMLPSSDSNVSFTISVLDWDKNTEISVDDSDLVNGVIEKPLEYVEIGDFYLSDGTLRDKDKFLTEEEKKKIIGIVFQTYKNAPTRFGEAEKNALKEKGVNTPHGLVMALKNANGGNVCRWKNDQTTSGLSFCVNKKISYENISGLGDQNKIKVLDPTFDKHLAFKVALEYQDIVPSSNLTTGWFLPSIGQWWDILANLGENTRAQDSQEQSNVDIELTWLWNYIESGGNSASHINKHLIKIGKDYVDLLPLGERVHSFWSSSECDPATSHNLYFKKEGLRISNEFKNYTHYVRSILAF